MKPIVLASKNELKKVYNYLYSIYIQITSQVGSLSEGPFLLEKNFERSISGAVLGALYPFAGFMLTPAGSSEAILPVYSLCVTDISNPIANEAIVTVQMQERDIATVSGQQVQLSTVSNPVGVFSSQGIRLNTTTD